MKAMGRKARVSTRIWIGIGLSVLLSACGGGGGGGNNNLTPPPVTYVLTVDSTNPSSGVAITVTPSDINENGNGSTSFTRTYDSGTAVTLTAPTTASGNPFSSWSGCTSASTETCNVTMSSNTTVTANYTQSAVTSVTVTPNPETATIGTQVQFAATVAGTGSFVNTVTWSVTGPANWTGSVGSISSSGLYETPYPAPATVNVLATSTQDTTVSGSATVTLQPPATAAGPALTVDAGNQTHAISPYIYGMNAFDFVQAVDGPANVTILRWGGDNTSRYNYVNGNTNSASDWYFENQSNVDGMPPTGAFDDFVAFNQSINAITLGTAAVLGWVANSTATACSFPVSTYPDQQSVDDTRGCGNGVYPEGVSGCANSNGCNITGNNPDVTSQAEGPAWAGSWVTHLVGKFGTAANGGVAIYDLDNEPPWWDAVHRDVHPVPFTYDEVTNNGIQTALAIKTADPSAQVSGPVMDYWWDYFYSKLDVENGWGAPPCFEPWSNPTDREAHGGTPLIEYYLQQFAAYQKANNVRLLDFLDLHTYFAAEYNGSSVAFSTAGDTGEQMARVDSTRVFWDPTYTDPNYPQPNYITDANYTSSCNTPLQAPQLIPMMLTWVKNDYPGTKTAITEYNWGGQEHINGAVAQADILGIFGAYGLDLGTLWGPPDATQVPGLVAFEIYRNYDGKNSTFGDTALASSSVDQSQLSVYGALRSADQAVTVVVINKTYGDLTATLSLNNLSSSSDSAQVFLYDNANLAAIAPQSDVPITPPSGGGTTSTISTTFPAQSITLLVVPKS